MKVKFNQSTLVFAKKTPLSVDITIADGTGNEKIVTIAANKSAATIYYTTDGTTPTTSSKVYTSAVTAYYTQTFKALAVLSDEQTAAEKIVTVDSTVCYDGTLNLGESVAVSFNANKGKTPVFIIEEFECVTTEQTYAKNIYGYVGESYKASVSLMNDYTDWNAEKPIIKIRDVMEYTFGVTSLKLIIPDATSASVKLKYVMI